MYADPNRVRTNRITTNFDQYEYGLIEAWANYKGVEPAVLVREMALQAALELLSFPSSKDTSVTGPNPATQLQL